MKIAKERWVLIQNCCHLIFEFSRPLRLLWTFKVWTAMALLELIKDELEKADIDNNFILTPNKTRDVKQERKGNQREDVINIMVIKRKKWQCSKMKVEKEKESESKKRKWKYNQESERRKTWVKEKVMNEKRRQVWSDYDLMVLFWTRLARR